MIATLKQNKPTERIRYVYFDYFRAIAITAVVMGHCYGNWERDQLSEAVFSNLITGATALFAFISGFFFHRVFDERYEYKTFIAGKFKNIAIPYLILSTVFMLWQFWQSGSVFTQVTIDAKEPLKSIYAYLFNLLTGRTLVAYWYVPFIMTMFAASPLFRWIMRFSNTRTLLLLFVCFTASAYMHRPYLNLNAIHSFLYLLPFYVLGILYSKNSEAVNTAIKKNTLALFILVISIAITMSMAGQLGNMHQLYPWDWDDFDYMVPQKIALILLLLSVTMRMEKWQLPFLSYIAKISFALFFIHPWILYVVDGSILYYIPGGEEAKFIIRFIITMAASIVIAATVKMILGKRSKYFIGY